MVGHKKALKPMETGPVGLETPSVSARWMLLGTCRGHEKPDLWYPAQDRSVQDSREAEKLCSNCPVRERCLLLAVDKEEKDGVWGGYNMRPAKSRNAAIAEAAKIRAERESKDGAA